MFVGESGRIGTKSKPNNVDSFYKQRFTECPAEQSQKEFQEELKQQELKQQRYFNSPKIIELAEEESRDAESRDREAAQEDMQNEVKEETCEKSVSATTKALNQMDCDDANSKKFKKAGKTSMALRKKKFNQRLSKMLIPKNAMNLLQQLKPSCKYFVEEQLGSIPPVFLAETRLDGETLGTGRGFSKSEAKNSAAETAIKKIVLKAMSRSSEGKEEEDKMEEEPDDENETPENLPWAGLASFAIYKMFNEWQSEGTEVPQLQTVKKKVKFVNAPTKKNLPANATDLHPLVVLNMVLPGLSAVELERHDMPKRWVKMAYIVEGKTFSGEGGNKKDAKREAAKALLESLYGLSFPCGKAS